MFGCIKKFMNLDDPSHESILNVPGLSIKYNKKTRMAMMIWAFILTSPLLFVWILTEIFK